MRYRIIYDRTLRNYAGYTPDLPICTAAADTLDECRVLMRQGRAGAEEPSVVSLIPSQTRAR